VKWAIIVGMTLLGTFVMLWLIALLIWPGNLWGQPIWFAVRDLGSSMFTPRPVFSQISAGLLGSNFNIGSCDTFDSETGHPLNRTESSDQEECVYTDTSTRRQILPTPESEPTPNFELTPIPQSTREAPASPAQECTVIDEYEVRVGGTALSSGDDFIIHAQLWAPGFPEHESALEAGTYGKRADVAGYVWLYSSSCTMNQVLEEVSDSIKRRQLGGANNDGYVDPDWFFDQDWLSR